MSEKLKESLSAVIDGEADEFELRRVLDEVGKDAELQLSWDRYHLIGSVMRRERVGRYHSMRDEIWLEVRPDEVSDEPLQVSENEPVGTGERTSRRGRFASLAVAASVAFAVVIGFLQFGGLDGGEGTSGGGTLAVAEAIPETTAETGVTDAGTAPPVALTSEVSASDQLRTDAYKIYHMQQLGMNQSGFSGFARMVSYERD